MKNNKTIIFLVLAGIGVWYYMKKKNSKTTEVLPSGKGGVNPDQSLYPTVMPTSDINFTFSINGYKKKLGNVPNTI